MGKRIARRELRESGVPPGRSAELQITPARTRRPFSEIERVTVEESTESALDELREERL
ncbi:hypothetical protein [Nocardioides speluncae]|uniref:hypothetical protein n=1 Tax=Nocardioides speluncae TaxID=2670337 RepID=UPI0012B17F57|nr:hypothetical protein [Nocardioides speluncae]